MEKLLRRLVTRERAGKALLLSAKSGKSSFYPMVFAFPKLSEAHVLL